MDQLTMQFVLIGGFMLLAYVFMIKPQKKRQKEIMEMRNNLKIGDSIITIGGIKGKIVKLTDTDVIIETSEKMRMKIIIVKKINLKQIDGFRLFFLYK